MNHTDHFVTGNFVSHAVFVDDATYSVILDTVVKAVVDVQLTRRDGRVLLGRRVGLPHSDWWIPGGRMVPGEPVPAAAARLVKREVGVSLAAADVTAVTHFTYSWDSRTQPPTDHGTSDAATIVTVAVGDDAASAVAHDPREYSALAWFDAEALVRDGGAAADADFVAGSPEAALPTALHPALLRGLRDLLALRQWRRIAAALDGDAADCDVVAALRAYRSLAAR